MAALLSQFVACAKVPDFDNGVIASDKRRINAKCTWQDPFMVFYMIRRLQGESFVHLIIGVENAFHKDIYSKLMSMVRFLIAPAEELRKSYIILEVSQ